MHDIVNEQCVIDKFQCDYKFDCLVHEMPLIRELTLSFNVPSDSVKAKLFALHWICTTKSFYKFILSVV